MNPVDIEHEAAPSATLERLEAARWTREQARWERRTLRRARFRAGILLVLLVLLLLGLGGRVAYWQIARHAQLAAWAQQEHQQAIELPAGRGRILDSNGNILALSVTKDTVIADPSVLRLAGPLPGVATQLARILGLAPSLVLRQVNVPGEYVLLRDASGQPLLLSAEQSAQVEAALNREQLPGVSLLPKVVRVYPEGALAAQMLGFIRTSDGAAQYGIEQAENAVLAGQPGMLYTAVDAAGNPLAGATQRETAPQPGADVRLTLDANIQYWVEQGLAQTVKQMRAQGGTVIVLDPRTGAIRAMASVPSFDPNAYARVASDAVYANPAVDSVNEPGSVMKAVTMAAGIDAGVITPDSTLDDTGSTTVDGVTISNFNQEAHGTETMTQVLQYSANVGAIWVEQRLGRERLERYITAFGFEAPTGVGLPGEEAGYTAQSPSPSLAELDAAENAFGESIEVTPLQTAMAYAALANGGLLLRPSIVASVVPDQGAGTPVVTPPQVVRRVVSAATARTVTQMLVQSARLSEAQMNEVQGYTVAAKTGTATPDKSNPYNTVASVVGYAPASNPKFVLLVQLNMPKTSIFGGEAAGPLWRSLAEQLFVYYGIPPDA